MKVDFLIIGAQKCGTTSLHEYLKSHKQLFLPEKKELEYFSSNSYSPTNISNYHSYFKDSGTRICGEASPQYMASRAIAERIYKYNPKMKIIICLRDPIQRAISHYKMNIRRRIETKDINTVFKQILESPEDELCEKYLEYGKYTKYIREYEQYFSSEQIYIVGSKSLKSHKSKVLKEISSFLKIEESLYDSAIVEKDFHKAGEVKFKLIQKLIQLGPSLPVPVKKVILSLIPPQKLFGIIHKIETNWNVSSSTKSDISLDPSIHKELTVFFHDEYESYSHFF